MFCSFSVILQPITISDPLVNDSTTDYNSKKDECSPELNPNKDNDIFKTLKDVFLVLLGLFVGYFLNYFLNKKIIRMSEVIKRSNDIKSVFVTDLVTIENINPDDGIEVGEIVVRNIINTDTLIQQFLFYVDNSKRKKIEKDYADYKNPYKADTISYMIKRNSPKPGDISVKISKYEDKNFPDAKEKAIKHLKILIKDFERV